MPCPRKPRSAHERGFVLIVMSACMFLLLAVVGLCFDLGRIYIARNEAQIFVDAASLAAAQHIDGTAAGIERARSAVKGLPNRWNLGTEEFSGVILEFSGDADHWDAQPKDTAAVHFARVTAPDNHVGIVFLRAVGGPESLAVAARAVAATNPVRLAE